MKFRRIVSFTFSAAFLFLAGQFAFGQLVGTATPVGCCCDPSPDDMVHEVLVNTDTQLAPLAQLTIYTVPAGKTFVLTDFGVTAEGAYGVDRLVLAKDEMGTVTEVLWSGHFIGRIGGAGYIGPFHASSKTGIVFPENSLVVLRNRTALPTNSIGFSNYYMTGYLVNN